MKPQRLGVEHLPAPSRRPSSLCRLALCLALGLLSAAAIVGSPRLSAQTPDPERPAHQLDEIVVVSHGTETTTRESIAATTVLGRTVIEKLAARNLPDVLRHVPGLVFLDRDGSGERSMAIARGFFGGGETEYVLVTVDGVPINDLRTGGVDWTQVPVSSIERIEVLRGAGSTVYGDAAIGAVINIVTRRAAGTSAQSGQAALGAWDDVALEARVGTPVGKGSLGLDAAIDRSSGYRDHSTSTDYSISAGYRSSWGGTTAYLQANAQRMESEDPGPLRATAAAVDPRQANPLYGTDERTRRHLRLGAGVRRPTGTTGLLSADLRLEAVGIDETSTLLLAPSFGNTQLHDEDDLSVGGRLQYSVQPGRSSLTAGAELDRGVYDSRYFEPESGGSLLTEGSGSRTKIGLYGEIRHEVVSRLRVFAGLRYDAIWLDRESSAGSDFDQWSPRVGANLEYSSDERGTGNLYAVWTRSFKAPTLAQLYDERDLPTGVPGEVINISNPDLLPQRATGIEVGLYQKLPFESDILQGEVSVSAYRLDLDDEIDFDLSTFRYGNILESRHDGIEITATAYLLPRLTLTHSSTWMDVTFRSGGQTGNRLKNLPASAMTNTVRVALGKLNGGGQASITHRFASSVYLDDENAIELSGGSTFDAAVGWNFGRARVQVAAMNIADAKLSRVGFLLFDPATSGQVEYVYPSAGRHLRATLSFGP